MTFLSVPLAESIFVSLDVSIPFSTTDSLAVPLAVSLIVSLAVSIYSGEWANSKFRLVSFLFIISELSLSWDKNLFKLLVASFGEMKDDTPPSGAVGGRVNILILFDLL